MIREIDDAVSQVRLVMTTMIAVNVAGTADVGGGGEVVVIARTTSKS
jgi:hypothetical protein